MNANITKKVSISYPHNWITSERNWIIKGSNHLHQGSVANDIKEALLPEKPIGIQQLTTIPLNSAHIAKITNLSTKRYTKS